MLSRDPSLVRVYDRNVSSSKQNVVKLCCSFSVCFYTLNMTKPETLSFIYITLCGTANVRLGPIFGHIGNKWDKSGIFFRSDPLHFGSVTPDLSHLRPICPSLSPNLFSCV